MERNQILQSNILDIIFDGKNKEYGAYDLRKTYNKRITIALGLTIALILFLLIGHSLSNKLSPKDEVRTIVIPDTDLKKPKLDEPLPPPIQPKLKTPPIATVQYTRIDVVKDKDVLKPPPDMTQ
ncbi:MAG: energy transducer TonB, partial [Ginsengibacter sp.]